MSEKLLDHIIDNYSPEYDIVPQKDQLFQWLDELLKLLFPLNKPQKEEHLKKFIQNKRKLKQLLKDFDKNADKKNNLTDEFYSNLEKIFKALKKDADKFLDNDPAAKCLGEILHTYPGFHAISIYRIANSIHRHLNIPYIPRMLSEYAHSKTGIDIHPGAEIGVPFMIDHGTGVVIGETCKIGKDVSIYQGVTLGALQVSKNLEGEKRHPTLEDGVIIYANATVLGGDTLVGNNSIIGGNVFLTKSVDPYSIVYSKPEIQIKKIENNSNAINFSI